ncbi:HD domain-containing protein [Sulfurirhabdus autotrophica]|uniref:Putative metal-dependent HD superfamily phosphohydrolase n=1 Tax=Sulfurirhabdus autotrophica TaxID=1706046 RepID=A0A4R3Y6M1_9PROT|nr:N-methyl-D-aspartate receptor NMDAR2C subunit [Sulfurirhabdus autotrophica]TCV87460.1 putative metal-dependent HD superfamily phosphohydrolase [Sulfurirhabdus autotrophica]
MVDLNLSWQRVREGLGLASDGLHTYEKLVSRYSEPHRKYHTLQHLAECKAWFQVVSKFAQHPDEVEAALWFHDAIYELKQHDNEERCTSWARTVLLEAGAATSSACRVENLILATKHTTLPALPDEQLLVDIDLSILGASEPRFAEYQRQIREEYSFVPEAVFREKRRSILRSFVDRRRIYSTDYFHDALEERARANLQRAISEAE